jgi:hypothetical protein
MTLKYRFGSKMYHIFIVSKTAILFQKIAFSHLMGLLQFSFQSFFCFKNTNFLNQTIGVHCTLYFGTLVHIGYKFGTLPHGTRFLVLFQKNHVHTLCRSFNLYSKILFGIKNNFYSKYTV